MACQAPLSKGFSRQEYWQILYCLSYRDVSLKDYCHNNSEFKKKHVTKTKQCRKKKIVPFSSLRAPDSSISSVQSLGHVQLIATSWTAACQASLSITNSRNLLKFRSIESVMPSNHLIFCHPLLLLTSIFPSIRVFSNESVLRIRWPKYRSFSFSISPSNEYSERL